MADSGGVHVGQEDLPAEDARRICGTSRWVGVSTHNLEQLREADLTSVDYIAVGPIFSTGTKENPDPVVGLDFLRAARENDAKTACGHRRHHDRVGRRCVPRRGGFGGDHPRSSCSARSGRARARVSGIAGKFATAPRLGTAPRTTANGRQPRTYRILSGAPLRRAGEGPRPIRFDDDRRRLDDRLRDFHRLGRHRPSGAESRLVARGMARLRADYADRRA